MQTLLRRQEDFRLNFHCKVKIVWQMLSKGNFQLTIMFRVEDNILEICMVVLASKYVAILLAM